MTTDRLMAVLNVDQHAYTIPRGATKDLKKENKKFKDNYPFNERAILSVNTKPTVALCNEIVILMRKYFLMLIKI